MLSFFLACFDGNVMEANLRLLCVVAPEVIELKGASQASDIWSLGCTVIELLTGRPPYADIPNGMSGNVLPQLLPFDAYVNVF